MLRKSIKKKRERERERERERAGDRSGRLIIGLQWGRLECVQIIVTSKLDNPT